MPSKRSIKNKPEDMSKDRIQSFLETIARPVSLKEMKKYLGVEKKGNCKFIKRYGKGRPGGQSKK